MTQPIQLLDCVKSSKQPVTFLSKNKIQVQSGNRKEISLLTLLEAGARIQNPIHAHLCSTAAQKGEQYQNLLKDQGKLCKSVRCGPGFLRCTHVRNCKRY